MLNVVEAVKKVTPEKDPTGNIKKNQLVNNWVKFNLKGIKTLILTLDSMLSLRIGNLETGQDIWISCIYDRRCFGNIDLLSDEFYNIKWEWSGRTQGHSLKWNDIQLCMMVNKTIDEGNSEHCKIPNITGEF